MSQSQQRLEVTAHNIANVTTPGYKRQVAFDTLLNASVTTPLPIQSISTRPDLSDGKLVETGVESDLAIVGDGFFVVRGQNQAFYTRQGQFQRHVDGRLVGPQGLALQREGGGDLILHDESFAVSTDGVVLQEGEPIGRLAIVQQDGAVQPQSHGGGLFSFPESAVSRHPDPVVRQAMFEASNVSMGDEMVVMMQALRRAETGQRLVHIYDELMGRAISSFGQG